MFIQPIIPIMSIRKTAVSLSKEDPTPLQNTDLEIARRVAASAESARILNEGNQAGDSQEAQDFSHQKADSGEKEASTNSKSAKTPYASAHFRAHSSASSSSRFFIYSLFSVLFSDSSLATCDPSIPRPKLRGFFHFGAFFATTFALLLFLFTSLLYKFNTGIMIYLIVQLLQFGVSSFYHIPKWNPKAKRLIRYLDHSCIFLLISGTQTSVLLNTIPKHEMPLALTIIKLSWAITALGISRFFIFSKIYDIFDLILYICHGLVILPFFRIVFFLGIQKTIWVFLGGILYIVGGIIYGLEHPNPAPDFLGYHEIFHLFTLLANMCFAIVISMDYIGAIARHIFK